MFYHLQSQIINLKPILDLQTAQLQVLDELLLKIGSARLLIKDQVTSFISLENGEIRQCVSLLELEKKAIEDKAAVALKKICSLGYLRFCKVEGKISEINHEIYSLKERVNQLSEEIDHQTKCTQSLWDKLSVQ